MLNRKLHCLILKDAVLVTPMRYAALLAGKAEGYEIAHNARGRPQNHSLAPATLKSINAACVQAIKIDAAHRIDKCIPVWRQINALRFYWIDAIRTASDVLEEQVRQPASVEQLCGFLVSTHPLWPSLDASEIDS